MDKVTAETYLVLVPDIKTYGTTTYVYGIRVDRSRNTKPRLNRGEIAVRIKLNFDKRQLIDAIPIVEADVTAFATPSPELSLQPLGEGII